MAAKMSFTKKMCKRYHVMFYFAFVLLTMQLYLAYMFYSIKSEESTQIDQWKKRIEQIENDHKSHGQVDNPNPQPLESHGKSNQNVNEDHKLNDSSPLRLHNQADMHKTVKPLNAAISADYHASCIIEEKDAKSALERARTSECRQSIADAYCLYQQGKLYPSQLPRYCPLKGNNQGEYVGCFKDDRDGRILDGVHEEIQNNSPTNCINFCLMSGFEYAGLEYRKECWCGQSIGSRKKIGDANCDTMCPGDALARCGGYLTASIYHTGFGQKPHNEASLVKADHVNEKSVRVVFVLTVNGRAVRQVKRLFKALYHVHHYYYIHVDSRQDYLHRELLNLSEMYHNVRLASRRLSTIWGGASLLTMHLAVMEDLLAMDDWHWDYFINLSESDFPIKHVDYLVAFLSNNNGKNFLKSHGTNTPRFVRKQGLDHLFHECDTHMWRLGRRRLVSGVYVDGGSDWYGLHRTYCNYSINSNDPLVTGLKAYWKHALLPAESFFHTLLQNSAMCKTVINNNLHLTNWRRKQGCKCQYKHIVDWCGCSPNDFLTKDYEKIMSQERKPIFFARKFEAIINQAIINKVETNLFGSFPEDIVGLESYWQNDYHFKDKSSPDDAYMTAYDALVRRSTRFISETMDKGACNFLPGAVLEVTLYNHNDEFQGLLLNYNATNTANSKTYELETLVYPIEMLRLKGAVGPAARLQTLKVSTQFDPKEELFRNFGELLGPFSDIALRHEWGSGPELSVTVAYIDPANVIAASYEVTIKVDDRVLSHKPEFKKPLRPGVWTVKVLYLWQLVAEVDFVVLPLTYYQGKSITGDIGIRIHNGPHKNSYVDRSFKNLSDALSLRNTESLKANADRNAQRTGKDVRNWVDGLMKKRWTIGESCVVDDMIGSCPRLQQCKWTAWSSKSPDPKSEVTSVDQKTGFLIRSNGR